MYGKYTADSRGRVCVCVCGWVGVWVCVIPVFSTDLLCLRCKQEFHSEFTHGRFLVSLKL